MGAAGTATIDFGAHPGSNTATVVVTGQAGIGTSSHAEAWVMAETSADHTAADHTYLARFATFTPGTLVTSTGFTIYGVSEHKLTGRWTVHWVWN